MKQKKTSERKKNINGILMVAMACAGSPKDHRCLVFYFQLPALLPYPLPAAAAVRVSKKKKQTNYNQV